MERTDERESISSSWLTAQEAARKLSTSAGFIRKAIRSGRLQATNISLGHRRAEWRIRRDQLEAFMGAGMNGSKPLVSP